MTRTMRFGTTALALAAVAGLLYLAGPGTAGGKEENAQKANVLKLAKMIGAGNADAAAKVAAAVGKQAKDDDARLEMVADVMHLLKKRSKGGLGFGEKKPSRGADGLEDKINEVRRDAPAGVAKDADAYQQMGYRLAAVADLTKALAPAKDSAGKKRADWLKWSDEMHASSMKLVEAAKSKSGAEVKAAATKLNAACNACHSVFRQ